MRDKMSGHRNFKELLAKMSSERLARIKAEMDDLYTRSSNATACMKRIACTITSFWLAGIGALVVMGDSGAMSIQDDIVYLPFMAIIGVFVGPYLFVAGVHGLIFGYGSDAPPLVWAWVALSYASYVGLFIGAVVFKRRRWRLACLAIEALSALIAAKGVAYCI